MNPIIKTVTPAGEALYLVDENRLADEIRKYLVHLARHVKEPIEIPVIRARPQCIATDIHMALLAHEQKPSRREGLAAHECGDPHDATSLEKGRLELASFIALIARPLAEHIWTDKVHVEVKIGHELPAPIAMHGMAMCLALDCTRGIWRQRFAPTQETCPPSSEKNITLGVTITCRPGKIGVHEVHEEKERGRDMGLLQSDAALFRWTSQTMLILDHLKTAADQKHDIVQQAAIQQANNALIAYIIILRAKTAAEARAQANAVTAVANILPSAGQELPYADELRRILGSVKHLSAALGDAIEHIEAELDRSSPANSLSVPHSPRSMVHHGALPELVPEEA